MSPEEAYTYAAALCNKAEYCRFEILTKLRNKGLESSDASTVLQKLEEQRLVDDHRYAMAFARQKFRNQLWGRRKIDIELRRKHIAADTISDALGQISDRDYASVLRTIIAKKAKSYPRPLDRSARTAIARYAISRGFEPSLVFPLLPH